MSRFIPPFVAGWLYSEGKIRWQDLAFNLVAVPLVLVLLSVVAVRLIQGTVQPATPLVQARLAYFDATHGDLQRRVGESADHEQAAAASAAMMACVHDHLASMRGLTDHQIEGLCAQEQLDRLEATHLDVTVVARRREMLARLGFVVPIQE